MYIYTRICRACVCVCTCTCMHLYIFVQLYPPCVLAGRTSVEPNFQTFGPFPFVRTESPFRRACSLAYLEKQGNETPMRAHPGTRTRGIVSPFLSFFFYFFHLCFFLGIARDDPYTLWGPMGARYRGARTLPRRRTKEDLLQ